MDLKGFYKNLVMTDKYSEKEKELINNRVLEQVQNMIRGLVDLSIICADIKPANMVVKYETKRDGKIDVNSIKVRLIDLDGDWCTRFENGLPYTPERRSTRTMERKHKENIELLMLVILGFHFNNSIKYNPFTAYFKDVFRNKTSSELHTMLREPTTISHEVIDPTTDLSLLPLNETYDHYFLDKDPNDEEVIIPDPTGEIFENLCKRIQSPYEPPSGTSTPTGSMSRSSSRSRSSSSMSFGGKKQKTLRYKISKRKGGSTKLKTLKIRKI